MTYFNDRKKMPQVRDRRIWGLPDGSTTITTKLVPGVESAGFEIS